MLMRVAMLLVACWFCVVWCDEAPDVVEKSSGSPKKVKSARDWSKMTDEDFDRIAGDMMFEDLDEDDDFYEDRMRQRGKEPKNSKKGKKGKKGKKVKKGSSGDASSQVAFDAEGKPYFPNGFDPQAIQSDQHRNKPQLMFIHLKEEYKTMSDDEVTELATRWRDLLASAGVDATLYNIEPGTVLVSLQKGQFGEGIKEFALLQPETEYFEWESVKSYPE